MHSPDAAEELDDPHFTTGISHLALFEHWLSTKRTRTTFALHISYLRIVLLRLFVITSQIRESCSPSPEQCSSHPSLIIKNKIFWPNSNKSRLIPEKKNPYILHK